MPSKKQIAKENNSFMFRREFHKSLFKLWDLSLDAQEALTKEHFEEACGSAKGLEEVLRTMRAKAAK